MDLTGAFSVLGQSIDLVRTLRDVQHDLDKGELKAKMAELYSDLADVKMALTDAKLELSEKDNEMILLKEHLEFKVSLIEIEGFKFDEKDGRAAGLAYCPKCEVSDQKFYRLTKNSSCFSSCPNCNVTYNVGSNGSVHQDLRW